MQRVLSLVALAVLALAAWRSVMLAQADQAFRSQTPEGVQRAIEMAPSNTTYLAARALQVEYEGGDPDPLLRRIGELNPASSSARIRLGLSAEARGDVDGAEKWLLEAYAVD